MNARPIARCKAPPDRVDVSFCPQCGEVQCAAIPAERDVIRTVCNFCPGPAVPLVLVRYQLARRSPR